MKRQYSYSNDLEFLGKIDALRVQEQWVKITLLEYSSEVPIENIEGKVVSGSLTKDGSSAVRRTCSLSCVVDAFTYNPDDIQAKYSISKKIYLELGVTNTTNNYVDEEIIWFPQGVFFITSMAISSSASGSTNINLEFKDKMATLDGTLGGVLPATVRFDTVTTVINDVTTTSKTLVYDIIMEVVNHFGGEDLSNIIIDDIPTKAKRIIRWMGAESLWIYPISNGSNISYDVCFTSDIDEKQGAHNPIYDATTGKYIGAKEYKTSQDIGYMYEDFVYDDELTFNAGSKVTDVLDKIKSWLGNYEYFYDEYGQFHFQEIKNYLNNSQSNEMWNKIIHTNDLDYLRESAHGKAVYTFDDNTNLISITNTPVYENIKNDFIVEGTTTTDSGTAYTCRYHLVIDDKPTITTDGYNNILMYTDPLTGNTTITKPNIITPKLVNSNWTWSLPEFAADGEIYGLLDEPQTHVFTRPLKSMDDFGTYYNELVSQENSYIQNDTYSLISNVKQDLFTLLENHMGYTDTTPYKEQYRDVIFSLARQLKRYNVAKQTPTSTTIAYYTSLYNKFTSDISNYGTAIQDRIKWCGGLLQLLYDLFNNIGTSPSVSYSSYVDTSYWPAINTTIPQLWTGISSGSASTLKVLRRSRCISYIYDLQIKQRHLSALIDQYTQIINNYNVKISLYTRNGTSTTSLVNERNQVQNQINNYKAQQEICDKRLTMLYAALTALGVSNLGAGEVYYNIDIAIPVRVSSFWYYNSDSSQDNYGWNELTWYKYYHTHTSTTSYYPYGIGSMSYIDYSSINWEDIEHDTNTKYPSMNRYSSWYQNQYISYAEDHDLPYSSDDSYIPTDWRTELILMGMRAEENGTDPGYYYQELKANWPTVYDFKAGQLTSTSTDYINNFIGYNGVIISEGFSFADDNDISEINAPTSKAKFKINEEAAITDYTLNYENDYYYYFFDMIDSSSSTWGEYSVNNIGRRTNVNVSDSVNCIFAPKIPDYAFINVSGLTTQERRAAYTELADVAEDIIQVTDVFYNNFATGGYKQSAYEQIKYDLQQYTSYQNTLSITAVPCFYLEPNVRVTINDDSTGTFGDYMVKSISIPLGAGNNMSLSLSKVMERN